MLIQVQKQLRVFISISIGNLLGQTDPGPILKLKVALYLPSQLVSAIEFLVINKVMKNIVNNLMILKKYLNFSTNILTSELKLQLQFIIYKY